MFLTILSAVIWSLLMGSRMLELRVLRQAEAREFPARMRGEEIPVSCATWPQRHARVASQNELPRHELLLADHAADRALARVGRGRAPRPRARRRPHVPRSPSGGFFPRQLPVWADKVAGVAVRIAFQVILVLGLRLPEITS